MITGKFVCNIFLIIKTLLNAQNIEYSTYKLKLNIVLSSKLDSFFETINCKNIN